jgi:hypothetical protein
LLPDSGRFAAPEIGKGGWEGLKRFVALLIPGGNDLLIRGASVCQYMPQTLGALPC